MSRVGAHSVGHVLLTKQSNTYDAANQIGKHWNLQISEVVDKVLASFSGSQMFSAGAVVRNQFANVPERGARDVLV